MTRGFTTEGIVLKRSNLGEADKLITLFTPQYGKLILKARSLRRASSKQASSLQVFNFVKCQVIPTKGPIDIITQSQLIRDYHDWKKHLGRVTLAYQLCEAVDKLTPERESHPALFQLLVQHLTEIGSLEATWQQVTDRWLLEVLIELGYWPAGQQFTGDILTFVESHSERPLRSPKLLVKLSQKRV